MRLYSRALKRALKVTSPLYLCSLIVGIIIAILFPGYSQSFSEFAKRGTVIGALIKPFLEQKNPLMLGLSIFLINFVIAGFGRFVLIPILLYHVAYFLAVSLGFSYGFVIIGSPSSLSYLSDFSSFGTVLYVLLLVFENLGFITLCAIGYVVGRESQEGLSRNDFLKLLLWPIHLKDAARRLAVKRGLIASIPWILLSMVFFILGAIFETWLIIYFR